MFVQELIEIKVNVRRQIERTLSIRAAIICRLSEVHYFDNQLTHLVIFHVKSQKDLSSASQTWRFLACPLFISYKVIFIYI